MLRDAQDSSDKVRELRRLQESTFVKLLHEISISVGIEKTEEQLANDHAHSKVGRFDSEPIEEMVGQLLRDIMNKNVEEWSIPVYNKMP